MIFKIYILGRFNLNDSLKFLNNCNDLLVHIASHRKPVEGRLVADTEGTRKQVVSEGKLASNTED